MKFCLTLLVASATFLLAEVNAQTGGPSPALDQLLIGEEPGKLIQEARRDGNVVRGAILFHQGNINCAKCHRPTTGGDPIAPDLSRMDSQVTDEQIVESILQPSKTIRKGYETVKVLTIGGRVIAGVVVADDAGEIVLRELANVDRLVTVNREDVDEIQPGTVSGMPAGLVNELKDRRQFLDLLRYVIELRERGPSAEFNAPASSHRNLTSELAGLVLVQEKGCVACHESPEVESFVSAKKAPRLKWSGRWLNPEYLARFIADPHATKHGTSMPNLLDALDSQSRASTAEAITHFLVGSAGSQFGFAASTPEAQQRGGVLFHSVGCVACHAPRDTSANEQPQVGSIPLGDLTNKYSLAGLGEFLENPHAVRPSGRMPNMRLTHFEAQDLASYLLQVSEPPSAHWEFDASLAQLGKVMFKQLKCVACHTDLDVSKSQDNGPALAQLRIDQGCLSDGVGDWPKFHLDAEQKSAIRATLSNFPEELSADQRIDVALQSFRCFACHDRNGLGGVTDLTNPHFQTGNMNLGDQGRIPPTLTGAGAKLKSKWMREVLVNGRSIRPYMNTRMPQYGEENVGYLIDLFQQADELPSASPVPFNDQKEMRTAGLEMAGNKGLNCVACHTYQYKLSDTMPAVDLTEMTDRLKKDWFHQYMLAPQKFSPNTVMPSFWPGGVAIRKDIAGAPEYQVEALWQYLIDGRQARAPSGVVREPLEIVVETEAKLLRRNYQGIGKRGIGVGYPGGVNLAFDAEQMRLAMIWKGKFIDPAGAWNGQGSGTVRPLGRPVNFAKGPDLDDASDPWVADDGRPPHHQFEGYDLKSLRRPSFRYRFKDVDVQDYFEEFTPAAAEQIQLRRTLKLTASGGQRRLRFRALAGTKIAAKGDGVFVVDQQMRVRLDPDAKVKVVDAPEGQQLHVLLSIDADEPRQLVIEYLWQ